MVVDVIFETTEDLHLTWKIIHDFTLIFSKLLRYQIPFLNFFLTINKILDEISKLSKK